jgi:hypothetical protein
MPVAARKESERGWLAVVSQIIRHWLMANCRRANTENVSMRTAVMVVVCSTILPTALAIPNRTPVPLYRYRSRGQEGLFSL